MMSRGRGGRADARTLGDLQGVGKATLADLARLDVHDVATLARQEPALLYDRLCVLSGTRQDPCVLDVLSCAVAQARDPALPPAQRDWWWWSRARKAAASAPRGAAAEGSMVRTPGDRRVDPAPGPAGAGGRCVTPSASRVCVLVAPGALA